MKSIITLIIFGVLGVTSPLLAQEFQSIQATEADAQQGRIILDSDANESEGNEGDPDRPVITGEVEAESETTTTQPEWTDYNSSDPGVAEDLGTEQTDIGIISKPQTDETAVQYNESDLEFINERTEEGSESGEKGGTEDINIGVGELQETRAAYLKIGDIKGESDDSSANQAKKPKEIVVVGSKVREAVAAGVVVRGWDPEKKEARIGADEVQTEGDFVDYAAGVLVGNDTIENIEVADTNIGVETKQSVKIFGILPATMEMRVDVDTASDESGRVKVKFPWWSFLAKTTLSASDIESSIESSLTDSASDETESQKYQVLSSSLEAMVGVFAGASSE